LLGRHRHGSASEFLATLWPLAAPQSDARQFPKWYSLLRSCFQLLEPTNSIPIAAPPSADRTGRYWALNTAPLARLGPPARCTSRPRRDHVKARRSDSSEFNANNVLVLTFNAASPGQDV